MAYSYHNLYGTDVSVVRYFTVFGPAGRPDMSIFRFIKWIDEGTPIELFGDGSQSRCFCHVSDVVDGLIALSEHPQAFGRVFNLGGTDEISINDLAQRVIDLVGSKSSVEYIPYSVAYEEGFEDMARRVPNLSRARELVGFAPSFNLDDILQSVIDGERS